jgi:hypothetical protein
VRRPDLPLILVALGMGAALAVLSEGEPANPVRPPVAAEADPVADFLANPDPALLRCFSGEPPPGDAPSPRAGDGGDEVVERVSAQVEAIRELRFARAVDARFLSGAELRARVGELVEEELRPREVRLEAQVLEELGAIPAGTDLYELTGEALGSQVIGLYDTKARQLLVRSSGEAGAVELITLAHELDHALADQAIGLRERVGPRAAVDRELAYQAVVEGDATLLMELYALAEIDLREQLSLGGSEVSGGGEFARLPDYVQRSLLFPYLEGLRLVCHRYVAGGWPAVDRLHERPPASSDEVIFPDRYGDGPPAEPGALGHPGAGWRLLLRRELGAAELEWLFSAPGGEPEAALPEPRRLVAGWAGGELELWARGEERALGVALAEQPGTKGICGALGAWYGAANPGASVAPGSRDAVELSFEEPGRAAVLACPGRRARMGIGPDARIALRLALGSTIVGR